MKIDNSRRHMLMGAAAFVAAGSVPAMGQGYPSRVIKLVCPFPAGSATDTQARFLAEQIGKVLPQKIIVENRPGASGNLAASSVARSDPDGYTLLLATNSSHAANQHLFKSLPFDPVKDFAPIARLTRNPLVLVVSEASPAKTVEDLLALAKAQPEKLSYGTGNTGSLAAAQLLMTLAQVKMTRVPYQGTPQAITDVLGGRIDVIITDVAVVREFVQTGKLRALGVTTAQRLVTMPGVPTIAEAGIAGYDFAAWSGLYGPAGLDASTVQILNRVFLDAMKGPEADRFFGLVGLERNPGNPAELAAYQAQQSELWGRIIVQTGIEKV